MHASNLTHTCPGYGQTETICVAGNYNDIVVKRGSMGRPLPGVPLGVVDEDGRIVGVGVEGDIAILSVDERGRKQIFTCDGYIDKSGRVDRKSRPYIDKDGGYKGEWHLTGDKAYQDADGYLWFVGRSDDVINSSGYRIGMSNLDTSPLLPILIDLSGPFEVESALKSHPAVLESAVVGVPDDERGEVVKAFVVLTADSSQRDEDELRKELQDHCKREAAPYKYPRRIEFVAQNWLPKTISGKIRRAEIRQWERKAAGGGSKL